MNSPSFFYFLESFISFNSSSSIEPINGTLKYENLSKPPANPNTLLMINLLDASGLDNDNAPVTPGTFCKKYFCDLVHPSHLPDSTSLGYVNVNYR